ncbi:DUF6809 family protein [Ethanoligenens sp.]|uniref:DUF6809 family protein n=1 Tax=Ethanoligenens sp. TaxID=2099655 RepID=UPI0039E8788D
MKSILTELYNGNVYPFERICPTDPAYRSINREISEIKQYLKGKLSDEDKQQLENLENLHCQSTTMELTDTFIYGFRLAALMMIEVHSESAAKEA